MKAVIFDLDDTLYPEIEYVRSGFKAVARYLQKKAQTDADSIFRELMDVLRQQGRGKVFDFVLGRLNISSPILISTLVWVYRSHRPQIRLYDDAMETLAVLKEHNIRPGLLTDGMGSVQWKKIEALGLEKTFDMVLCSDEIGPGYWKPSHVPFKIALDLLDVSSHDVAYVGDNPQKDFAAPNVLGMKTIQVTTAGDRAHISERAPNPSFEPGFVVRSLKDILPIVVGETK